MNYKYDKLTYATQEFGVERIEDIEVEVFDVTSRQVVEYDRDNKPIGLW